MTIKIALYQPEIPPNTGNIQRLCANMGAELHLIRPLGFQLKDRGRRRASMDYAHLVDPCVHNSYADFKTFFSQQLNANRIFALTTKGTQRYDTVSFESGDILLFGPETRGLPDNVLEELPLSNKVFLPMHRESRSLNLSNAVSITAYEAWRQLGFACE